MLPAKPPAAAVPVGEVLAYVRSHGRVFGGHFLGFSMLTLVFNAVAFWMAPYLSRVHGLSPAAARDRVRKPLEGHYKKAGVPPTRVRREVIRGISSSLSGRT